MVHVFIVNETTFKYHLQYMFAGTGAKDKQSTFLYNPTIARYPATTERNLMGMIADISRIRSGDKVVFYLQAASQKEGKFFGTFKVVGNAFFDENNPNNYLSANMGKGLSYRVCLEPDIVYAKGVTEHNYLDSLEDIEKVSDLCWSMIYRKLKGNRGCTMITNKEYNRLVSKLEKLNNHTPLIINGKGLTYNAQTQQIEIIDTLYSYDGVKKPINITNRLIYKFNNNNAFETHLQAYILQNLDSEPLKHLLQIKENLDLWIGNEVSCGVGMQRIDILTIQEDEDVVYANIIELKCKEYYDDIVNRQLPWYIKWFNDYIADTYNKTVVIQPIVLTNETQDVSTGAIININARQNVRVNPVKNIFFNIANNEITFRLL